MFLLFVWSTMFVALLPVYTTRYRMFFTYLFTLFVTLMGLHRGVWSFFMNMSGVSGCKGKPYENYTRGFLCKSAFFPYRIHCPPLYPLFYYHFPTFFYLFIGFGFLDGVKNRYKVNMIKPFTQTSPPGWSSPNSYYGELYINPNTALELATLPT